MNIFLSKMTVLLKPRSARMDVYVKLNGYAFRFILEERRMILSLTMTSLLRSGKTMMTVPANRDADMSDKDASKRAKSVQAEGEKTTPVANSVSTVPMQTNQLSAAPWAPAHADMLVRSGLA